MRRFSSNSGHSAPQSVSLGSGSLCPTAAGTGDFTTPVTEAETEGWSHQAVASMSLSRDSESPVSQQPVNTPMLRPIPLTPTYESVYGSNYAECSRTAAARPRHQSVHEHEFVFTRREALEVISRNRENAYKAADRNPPHYNEATLAEHSRHIRAQARPLERWRHLLGDTGKPDKPVMAMLGCRLGATGGGGDELTDDDFMPITFMLSSFEGAIQQIAPVIGSIHVTPLSGRTRLDYKLTRTEARGEGRGNWRRDKGKKS
ncbi:hypothetical protein KEM55_008896 [Ascosphaera atra]|nr:hypothetical protein KEM55_008896 [Ascosphaera atra]